jgi:hypothetical protein
MKDKNKNNKSPHKKVHPQSKEENHVKSEHLMKDLYENALEHARELRKKYSSEIIQIKK